MKKELIMILAGAVAVAGCNSTPQLSEKNIDKVVKAMTLEEKALLVTGIGMDTGSEGMAATVGASAQRVPGAAGATHAIERLGIPSIVLSDGPAGVRINPTREGDENTYYCTHFPIGTLLSSTWNQELVEEVGVSMGNEVLEYGCDVLLAPALNIHRNPLNGRNFEYYSEDPVLSGKIAAAYVRGIQSNGVGTSIKHFVANNQETNRTAVDEKISDRAMREIYLKGFEITVKESDPWTIMTSYNKINGIYTSEDHTLLEDILRDDWGYKGTVMTDWYGGKDAVAQVHAGNDMLQPGRPSQYEDIINGVKNGTLDEAELDRNVKRILQLIVRTPIFKKYAYSNKPDLEAHAKVTRQSAVEGMVLLENKNATLPLAAEAKNVAVFGNTSYDFIAGGTGSGNVNRAYTVSLLDGLSNAGLQADANLQKMYEEYLAKIAKEAASVDGDLFSFLPKPLPAEFVPAAKDIAAAAAANDVAIITFGRISGEFVDRTVADFNLSAKEKQLVNDVTKAFHAAGKKVIVVLNIGGVIETASWKNTPDAILLSWQAGQEGGNSVADVLTGKENPSGRLPMTWPVAFEDHKSSENFPRSETFELNLNAFMGLEQVAGDKKDFDWTKYEEGIYVGYRWFDKSGIQVSYPFGYGLSYTTFEYSTPEVAKEGDKVCVKLSVKNTGAVAGKEVVQLYVSAPGKTMDKPVKELKAFAKTATIAAGESADVTLCFNVNDLASWNEETSAWELENGTYTISLGSSCLNILTNAELAI
ncbi:MAG: glycoside hydrolase family 3 C-terminal domain-containing protein [Bacteroidales bacterium]|nr:glycoside hydrolase family 3 C-terminal domain-containing protein [Bacteroidales bacterium]